MNTTSSLGGMPDETFVVPCEVVWYKDKPLVGYAEVEGSELLQPFWVETVRRRKLVTLRPLDDIAAEPAHFRLAGMILAMGRCGSTLLSTLLSSLPGVYVLREPTPFFDLLDRSRGAPAERLRWVQRLMAAYGNAFGGRLRHLVIKWAPFAVFYANEITAAFPGVPAIFMHRDPVEVLVSLYERPARMNEVFLPEWFSDELRPQGLNASDARSDPDLTARMIAAVCDAMCGTKDLRLLDYRSLPEAAWSKVAPFFGLDANDAERLRMTELAKFYAKSVSRKQEFKGDSQAKQVRADEAMRTLARRFVEPRLEHLKTVLRPL